MPAITLPDLNNAKLDVDHIAAIATSTELTATDRLGQTKRTLNGQMAAVDAELAAKLDDAQSQINVKVNEAAGHASNSAASALEAYGYLQAYRATSYGALASDPATDPLGNPPTVGDEYFNTTANLLKRWNGTTWQASDINTANLAAPSGSSLVGYDGGTVQDVLDAVTGPNGAASVGYTPAGTGAASTDVQDELRKRVNVDNFVGVDRTGAADSYAGFVNAIAHCNATGKELFGDGTYLLSSMPVISCDCDFWGATFNVPGTRAIGIEISTGSSANPTNELVGKRIRLGLINNTTKPSTGWVGQNIGVRAVNALTCDIIIRSIRNFAVGLRAAAYSTGFAYSNINVFYYDNNKVNLQIQPGDATGYVNECNWYGGRYHHRSTEGSNVSGARHIQLLPFDVTNSATSWPNNNLFHKPSVEGDVPEYHVEISGDSNLILSGRWESTQPKVLLTGHASNNGKTSKNLIFGGYQSDLIEFSKTGLSVANELIHPRKHVRSGFGLNRAINNYDGDVSTTPVNRVFSSVKDMLSAASTDTDWTVNEFANGFEAKRATDAYARVFLDYQNGRLYLGDGTAAPTKYIGNGSFGLSSSTHILPTANDTYYLGEGSSRWQRVFSRDLYADIFYLGNTFSGVPYYRSYTSSPEGSITAPVGSICVRTNGGANTTLYVKESGTGNTGWVAK